MSSFYKTASDIWAGFVQFNHFEWHLVQKKTKILYDIFLSSTQTFKFLKLQLFGGPNEHFVYFIIRDTMGTKEGQVGELSSVNGV